MITVGQTAPAFTLFSSEKKQVSLSSFEGKNVVLLFFPQAFTGTCTQELCDMRDNLSKYESLNAAVLAVSVDSVFTLDKYKSEQNYNFPMLSDFNKDVSTAYGSIYEDFVFGMKGVSKRSAFVIDGAGVVRYAEVLDNAGEIPNFTAIRSILAEI